MAILGLPISSKPAEALPLSRLPWQAFNTGRPHHHLSRQSLFWQHCMHRHAAERDSGMAGAGFFIGDGAGVGKGRQIAGIILDNYARGRRRAVWLSTSTVSPQSLWLLGVILCPKTYSWSWMPAQALLPYIRAAESYDGRVPPHCCWTSRGNKSSRAYPPCRICTMML